jgi:hypothetical protein
VTASDRELELAVRRHIERLVRNYLPLVVVVAVLAVLVWQAPSEVPRSNSSFRAQVANPSGSVTTTTINSTTSASPISAGGTTSGAGSKPVVSKTGCQPGGKQYTWSTYAPPCVASWSGNNGGATAPGVTGSTINFTFRDFVNQASVQSLASLFPGLLPPDGVWQAELENYINFFNTQFQLYGRKVVFKQFSSQSDFVDELYGQDQQQTEEDAQTAKSLNTFIDVTPLESQLYAGDLAAEGIISLNQFTDAATYLQSESPYIYSDPWPSADQVAEGIGSVTCGSLAGQPVSFAGSGLNGKPRVYGVIYSNSQGGEEADGILNKKLATCGIKPAATASYTFNLSELPQQSSQIINQMVSAGVTTVLFLNCDSLSPIYMTEAADNANWYPEWVANDYAPAFNRVVSQDQWEHEIAVSPNGALPALDSMEATKVYEMASGGAAPKEEFFYFLYLELLLAFQGIQAAGPNLTSQTFQRGLESLPAENGFDGVWNFQQSVYTPGQTFQVEEWSSTTTSSYDGGQGSDLPCYGGQEFAWDDSSFPSGPIQCPGK